MSFVFILVHYNYREKITFQCKASHLLLSTRNMEVFIFELVYDNLIIPILVGLQIKARSVSENKMIYNVYKVKYGYIIQDSFW